MQKRPQWVIIALIVIGVIIAGLLLFRFLNRGSDSGSLTGRTWQLASITGQTPAYQGVIPPAEQPLHTIAFATDGTFAARADCNSMAGTYTLDRSDGMTITPGREHPRGLPGRVVRQPLRTCPWRSDDVGDLRSRPDPDHVGWRDRHVRGLCDRACRRHGDGDGQGAESDAIARPRPPSRPQARRRAHRRPPRPRRQPARRHPPHRRPARRRLRHRPRRRQLCRPRRRHRPETPTEAPTATPAPTPANPPLPRPRPRRQAATSLARTGSSRRTRRAIPWLGLMSLLPSARSTPSRSQRTGLSARRPTATC